MKDLKRYRQRTTEIVFVEWNPNFYAIVEQNVVVFSIFTEKKFESSYNSDVAEKLEKKLEMYFSEKKVSFNEFTVAYPSNFSKRVLSEVKKIEYGNVKTYGEIARIIGTSPRAVGLALRMNKVPVIIPCHRVVAKDSLGGYSMGTELKLKLLKLEGVILL